MQQMSLWKYGLRLLTLPILLMLPVSAQEQTPADAASYVKFGMASGASGDLDKAISAFNQAIKIDPNYAPAYYNRSLAHSLQNKTDEGILDCDEAIKIDPSYKEAYYQRGSLKGQKGDFDGALRDFNAIIKIDPKFALAYYNSGHVEYFQNDLDHATEQINHALLLEPNYPFSYFIRGLIRRAQGQRSEAISDFQKSAGLGSSYAFLWVWITESENGQRGVARKNLSDALSRPESFQTANWPYQIGSFLLEKINQDQLLAKAQEGNPAELKKRLCDAWLYMGISRRLSGDSKGAQEAFAKAIATGAKSSEEFAEATRALSDLQKQ
jgi:tetratricopeptide (TPR) repeat protein